MNEKMKNDEPEVIEYLDIKLEAWYSSDDELFFGQVKVCLFDNYALAVISAGKSIRDMMEKLKRDYSNYVYGYNMAMAVTGGRYRLRHLNEDKNFEEWEK